MAAAVSHGDIPLTLKVIVIGSSNTGKSSLLLRYVHDQFRDNKQATVGVEYFSKMVSCQGETVRLSLWDTAGQERFRSITPNFYRNAHCVVLVYDVTERATFVALDHWLDEVRQYASQPHLLLLVVGNKMDRRERREVSRDEGLEFARRHRTMFMETSACTSEGVAQAFEELTVKALHTFRLRSQSREGLSLRAGEAGATPPARSGWCCS